MLNAAFKLLPEHAVAYDWQSPTQQHGYIFYAGGRRDTFCSTDDPDHPAVLYFTDEPVAYKLHAAGRVWISMILPVWCIVTDDGR